MQGCVVLCFMARSSFKRRPLAATYLCRKAAKARFDNRTNSRGEVSKGEGSRPLPFGRFKGKGSLRKGGNRNPPFLKWRSLVTFFRQGKKVTRRRHPAPGRGTPLSFGKESTSPKAKEGKISRWEKDKITASQTPWAWDTPPAPPECTRPTLRGLRRSPPAGTPSCSTRCE